MVHCGLGQIGEHIINRNCTADGNDARSEFESRAARWGAISCLAGATIGAIGLAGWLTPLEALTTVIPGQPVMMPNTAISLMLLGVAGALLGPGRQQLPRLMLATALVIATFMIGAGTLYEYLVGTNFGLDQLFVPSHVGPFPGRPSPPTALAVTLLSLAIPYMDLSSSARIRFSEWLILGALLIALVSLLGQLFGAGLLYRFAHVPVYGVAVPTAVGLFAISTGLLLQRPTVGVMRMIAGPGPGSELLRRSAPMAVLVPAGMGVVAARLVEAPGIVDVPLVFAAFAVLSAIASIALLNVTAVQLDRTHSALERSRMRTRELIDHASDGIFLADLNGRFVDTNEAACRMLGCTRDEIVGKAIVDFVPQSEAERIWTAREHVLRGETYVVEHTVRRKDGTYLPVEASTKLLPDGRWQAFVRDITERKRAEDALRLSEAKFSGIVSTSADAVVSVDGSRRITLFNDSAERMFGRSRAEAIGAPLDILIPERLRDVHGRHFERFLKGPNTARRMGDAPSYILGIRSNGEEFPADAAISKISVDGDTILTATIRDITAQQRLENEKRIAEEIVSALGATLDFEEVLTIIAEKLVREFADICVIDLEDEGRWRRARVLCRDPYLSWVSEALTQSHEPGERVTQPLLLQNTSAEELARWIPGEMPLKALRTVAPISAMLAPLVAGDKRAGQIVVLASEPSRKFDARDLGLLSSLIVRGGLGLHRTILYRAAVRATQARDDVLGIVAHDLRSPLQLLTFRAADVRRLGVDGAAELGKAIESVAFRMNRLIQDILDVTRLEAGRLPLRHERIVPKEVFADMLETLAPLASQASLELRLEAPPDLPEILGDYERLKQIFENLIGNAIKFTKPGGRIIVGAEANPEEIVFSVTDTGRGISEENLSHIFDRFWQASAGTRQGAGLGLPIVQGLVEAHGGRIWAKSTPGQGTTFYFTVPRADARREPTKRASGMG